MCVARDEAQTECWN